MTLTQRRQDAKQNLGGAGLCGNQESRNGRGFKSGTLELWSGERLLEGEVGIKSLKAFRTLTGELRKTGKSNEHWSAGPSPFQLS
jgi:hypothetical protein